MQILNILLELIQTNNYYSHYNNQNCSFQDDSEIIDASNLKTINVQATKVKGLLFRNSFKVV